ncbi:AzlD domain-containing protein [Tsukamurella sp. NPDC003166]|uniref:AzlD domain-containing protein n=1 Tax=Tsukamurella sp. NPDC003166 TaxID=3154444 RepID=UPI0033B2A2B4
MIGVLWAGAALAAVTLALRAAGPVMARRFEPGPAARRTVDLCALILLAGVAATSTFVEADGLASAARVCGVTVAGILAWRRVPLPLIILAAGGTTAGLRLLGVG